MKLFYQFCLALRLFIFRHPLASLISLDGPAPFPHI